MSQTILLELGTEELPARFVPSLLDELKGKCCQQLESYRIKHGAVKKMATPRRLAIKIEDVSDKQETVTSKKRGPSVDIAFDGEGNPTKAAYGFARGQGVSVDELQIVEDEGKQHVYAVKEVKGDNTYNLLPDIFQRAIDSMELPVRMFWKSKQQKFVRPIRWILAMAEDKKIPFSFGDVHADVSTRGHRFLGNANICLGHAQDYEEQLRQNYVMVDHQERKENIRQQVNERAASIEGYPEMPEDLLEEVNFLVEWPLAFVGAFPEEYLELPEEILITCMQSHQKYFAVWDQNRADGLSPYFIAIRNGDDQGIDIVKKGNERVLNARLSDARFFFEEDRKSTLELNCEALKHIVYREELGSLYEKVNRMEKLGQVIANSMNIQEPELSKIIRTTRLSKADLTTNIVDEFPKLQGIMGEKYARMDGEEEIVAQGIAEHYLPRFNKDEIPATLPGTVNSLADKIDNIASSFAIGERPTGNQDPFALRRQAIGIVNIITQGKWRLDLAGLFREAIDLLPKEALVDSAEHILTDILDFFKVRIKTVFQEQGFQGDLIESVLAVEVSDIFNAYEKTRLLQGLRGNEIFDHVTTAYQRLKNLSGKANGDPVNLELLREEQEEKLYREYSDIDGRVDKYLNQTDIKNAMHLLASLKPYVDAFFDHVLVMHEDTSVRNNRLNLIYQVKEMYRKIAEFSMLQA